MGDNILITPKTSLKIPNG